MIVPGEMEQMRQEQQAKQRLADQLNREADVQSAPLASDFLDQVNENRDHLESQRRFERIRMEILGGAQMEQSVQEREYFSYYHRDKEVEARKEQAHSEELQELRALEYENRPDVIWKEGTTERDKKKVEKNRKANLEKAQKQGYVLATENTIPFAEALKAEKKNFEAFKKEQKEVTTAEEAKERLKQVPASTFKFDEGDFDETLAPGRLATVDVGSILQKKHNLERQIFLHMKAYPNCANTPEDGQYAVRQINIEMLRVVDVTLDQLMAVNGVDFMTGGKLMDEEKIAKAKQNYGKTLKNYKELSRNLTARLKDTMIAVSMPKLREIDGAIEQNDRMVCEGIMSDPVFKDAQVDLDSLGFTFHNGASFQDYLKLVGSINKNPEKYAEHKEAIDACYKEYLQLSKYLAEQNRIRQSAATFGNGISQTFVKSAYTAWGNPNNIPGLMRIADRIETLSNMMRSLLEGKDAGFDGDIELDERFHIETPARVQQKQQLEQERERNSVLHMRTYAKSQCSVADEDSYRVLEEITKAHHLREASCSPYYYSMEKHGTKMDQRMVLSLTKGFHLTKDGLPETPEDEANMQHDKRLIDGLYGTDRGLTEQVVIEYVDSYCETRFDERIFEKDYLVAHAEELLEKCHRMLAFDNIQEAFPDILESLSERTKERIAVADQLTSVVSYIVISLNAIGVDTNKFEFMNEKGAQGQIRAKGMLEPIARQMLEMNRQARKTGSEDSQ